MRVGLLRHFPVEHPLPTGWRTAGELQDWRERYDAAAVTVGVADLGAIGWSACLCSDLGRAAATARAVFRGPIEQTALLREASFAPFRTGNLRLPVWLWIWVLRISWVTGHASQRGCRDEFRRRVSAAADLIEARAGDLLVVSHAGMMAYLSAELRRRGFAGPKLRMAKHATLYLFERESVLRPGEKPGGAGNAHEVAVAGLGGLANSE